MKSLNIDPTRDIDGPAVDVHGTWFVNDAWIALQLQMKPGTIRAQRYRRNHGQPHWFTIDPVHIGTKPRYIRSDVEQWILKQVVR